MATSMADEPSTRDRVRALVREVLAHALPEDETGGGEASTPQTPPTRASEINVRTPERARAVAVAPPAGGEERPVTRDESSKQIITEADVHDLAEGARLRVAESARLTPLAADIVRERGIELIRRPSRRGSRAPKRVAVGSDHGGFKMKGELKDLLAELGHHALDFGTDSTDAVDYPDFAHAVAH